MDSSTKRIMYRFIEMQNLDNTNFLVYFEVINMSLHILMRIVTDFAASFFKQNYRCSMLAALR